MNKQEESRDTKVPAQHTGSTTENRGQEKQTSYDGPLDQVEGEMNNGETGVESKGQGKDKPSAGA